MSNPERIDKPAGKRSSWVIILLIGGVLAFGCCIGSIILAGVGVPIYLSYIDNAKEDVARSGVMQLETAVMSYRFKNGMLPENLNSLTAQQPDGGPPILQASALRDPWGNLYVYDQRNLDALTGIPLIYSNGRPGGPRIANR